MSKISQFFRVTLRGIKLIVTVLLAMVTYFLTIKLLGRSGSIVARAAWVQQQARRFLWALGVARCYEGTPPNHGVLVSNHVSYLDIIVLAARMPMIFIAKAEVAHWPVFGPLTRFAGTLFIRRDRKSDVVRVAAEMAPVLDAGVPLAFFPEGTSSGGDRVLPFRASLLAPLVEKGWSVTPAFLHYELAPGDGVVADDVAYWRPEQEFGPHLLHLLGKRRIRAVVRYGQMQSPGDDRKELATRLREAICQLGGMAEPVEVSEPV